MKPVKHFHVFALASLAFSLVELVNVPPAGAVVGRPLTPVSVAGVARRTTRRCAVGVYNCQLTTPSQATPGLTVRKPSSASGIAMSTVKPTSTGAGSPAAAATSKR